MANGVHRPGTKGHTLKLRAAQTPAVSVGKGMHIGSKLHRKVVSYKIKPGTRAYRAAMQAFA